MTEIKSHNRKEIQEPQSADLYTLSAKIFALGELIKFRGGEPSLDEETVNYGIGMLLTDIAEALMTHAGTSTR